MGASRNLSEAPELGQIKYRQYSGPMSVLVRMISGSLCLFILLYVSGVLPQAGFYVIQFRLNAIFLAGTLVLVFLLIPLRKGMLKHRLPWYDVLFILAILLGSIYVFVSARDLAFFTLLHASPLQMVLGIMMIVAVLEAMRRTIGWAIVIIVLCFLLHAKFSYLLPEFAFSIFEQSWDKLIATTYLSFSGIFGGLTSIGSNIIFAFIAFGIFFVKLGGGDIFHKLALSLTGRFSGGPAKAAIAGSALFGMLSGSPTANVAVTGSVTIPMMKRAGYSATFAGAVESIASTGGQLMPPIMGATAFIMAGMLGVSYATVALAAIIPAILYYIALFFQTHLRAVKDGLRGIPRSELPSLRTTLKEGWEFSIPLLLLVVLLFVLKYAPPLAATYSIGALIVISLFRKRNRISLNGYIQSLEEATKSMLIVVPILAGSGIIISLVGLTGLGAMFASSLVEISGGSMLILLVLAGISSYILGMGGAMMVAYILLAVLVAPALASVGLPLIVAHFFVFYMGLSMFFTPPVCPVVYVAAGLANAKPYSIGFQAMRLGIVTYLVPFVLAYNPCLILLGDPLEIVLASVTAIVGVLALSIGLERYLFHRTNWLQSMLSLGAGVSLVMPGLVTDLIGASLLAWVVLWQWSTRESRPLTTAAK